MQIVRKLLRIDFFQFDKVYNDRENMFNYFSIRLICCFFFLCIFFGVYEFIIKIKCYIKKIIYFILKINVKILFNLKECMECKMFNYYIVLLKKSIKLCVVL